MKTHKWCLRLVGLLVLLLVSFTNLSCLFSSNLKRICLKGQDLIEEDFSRERQLESIPVGNLPSNTPLNAITLLSHANKQIAKFGMHSCDLRFECNPEDLLSETLRADIRLISSFDEKETELLLGRIGTNSIKLEKAHLEKMNLRQLLWFMCRKCYLGVKYCPEWIVIGTGFESDQYITPGESSDEHIPDNVKNQPDPFK